MIGHWQLRDCGAFAVGEKASGTVLEPVGYWLSNDLPESEIKWNPAAWYWGKGFAKEAAMAVSAAGRECLPDIKYIGLIHLDNESPIMPVLVVEAHFEKTIEYAETPFDVYQYSTTI